MDTPLISIITPAYNAEKYIAKTIESVLAQTHSNWEMIIADDGSTDNTANVIKPFLKDKRIKYFYQKNGKQGKARNLAISHSTGIYLAFLDADDLWTFDKLEKQLIIFSSYEIDVVYCQGWIFEGDDQIVESTKIYERNVNLGMQYAKDFLLKLLQKNQISALSVMVKKNKVLDVKGFGEELEIQNAEDYQLWLKLADSGCNFFGMEARLFYYRVHVGQSTSSNTYAPEPSIWAIENLKLISVSTTHKTDAMVNMLKKNILRDIDVVDVLVMKGYVNLLNSPLNMFKEFFLIRLSFFFGPAIFKKTIFKILFHK